MARKKLSPVQATRKSVRSLPPEKFSKAIEEAPIFGRGSYRSSVWPLSLVLCLCVCTLNQTQPLVCCMTASMLPVRDCPHSLRTPDLHVFAYVLCDRMLLLNVYSPSPDCSAAHVGNAAATGKSRLIAGDTGFCVCAPRIHRCATARKDCVPRKLALTTSPALPCFRCALCTPFTVLVWLLPTSSRVLRCRTCNTHKVTTLEA